MDMSMKSKNKGFTLVELLGVIVVLAVIALITTPMLIGVIEKAKKGALEDSAYGLIDSANLYYANNILEGTHEKTEFTFSVGEQTSEEKLSIKGKVEEGNVRLYSDGKVALCITEGDYVAVKNISDESVSVIKGRCSYNAETEEYETVGLCQDLQDELAELKQAHEEEIATLTKTYEDQIKQLKQDYEGQLKTQQETYESQITELTNQKTSLQTEINRINILGNATSEDIAVGKTAVVKGGLITGTKNLDNFHVKIGVKVWASYNLGNNGTTEATTGYFEFDIIDGTICNQTGISLAGPHTNTGSTWTQGHWSVTSYEITKIES